MIYDCLRVRAFSSQVTGSIKKEKTFFKHFWASYANMQAEKLKRISTSTAPIIKLKWFKAKTLFMLLSRTTERELKLFTLLCSFHSSRLLDFRWYTKTLYALPTSKKDSKSLHLLFSLSWNFIQFAFLPFFLLNKNLWKSFLGCKYKSEKILIRLSFIFLLSFSEMKKKMFRNAFSQVHKGFAISRDNNLISHWK